jgi:hypothetical protein
MAMISVFATNIFIFIKSSWFDVKNAGTLLNTFQFMGMALITNSISFV